MPQSVSQALASACHDGELLLFTGAGVSARAGGKTWTGILLSLADWAETYEPDLANLMRSRVKAGQLLQAATLFRRVLNAPEGEKSTALTDLFALKHYDWRSLMSLASLPIAGIVSTNYDASLLEAWKQILVQRDQETPHEIDKSHTNNAAWVKDPFYLFLHGRGQLALHAAEMVFDERDYERTYNDPAFTDGLLNLLSHRRLAFLGFSFTDPAILAILKSWRELRGTAFPQTPVAFISSDDTPLGFELARLNFKCIEYPSARHHEALWSAIAEVSKNLGSRPAADVSSARPFSVTFDAVRQLLGLCYAAAKMGSRVAPLRDVVLEGIVIALLEDAGKVGLARDVLTLEVGRRLGMPDVEVAPRLEIALGRLTSVGACTEDGLNLVSTHTVKNDLSEQTLQLARGVGKRMEVRESVALAPAETREISEVLVELFVVRAWDLAASFVSPVVGEIGSAASTLSSLVGRSKLSAPKREAAEHAIADLLNRPSRAEASILAELGRLGFALQIALGHARTTFSHGMTLPQRMYLDASVLMPAIVRGHPLASLYGPTIDRLRDQVKRMAGQIRIIAPEEFLNEIVSHRARAIEEVRALQLEDRDRLEREVRFRGTDGLNVFVAAYASLSAEFSGKGSFHKFLLAIAPYQTERALATYLRDLGFEVERLDSVAWRRSNDIGFIKSELEAGYAKDGRREKVGVLVEHEAWQVARLRDEQTTQIRSIFITADRRFRNVVAQLWGGELADSVMLGLDMVKLVDLLLGVNVDSRGLARALWGFHAADEGGLLRAYFTDLGLKNRVDVEAMSVPEVVEQIVAKASEEAKDRDLSLWSNELRAKKAVGEFLDQFEDEFYERLAGAIRDRKERDEEYIASLEKAAAQQAQQKRPTKPRAIGGGSKRRRRR